MTHDPYADGWEAGYAAALADAERLVDDDAWPRQVRLGVTVVVRRLRRNVQVRS